MKLAVTCQSGRRRAGRVPSWSAADDDGAPAAAERYSKAQTPVESSPGPGRKSR